MTDFFVIEKDVPMPRARGPVKYRWDLLEVGDSILLPTMGVVDVGKMWAKRNGVKFKRRKERIEPYGFRIWRVE